MGLLDYYRQFEDMDEEEVNRRLRQRRARERARALATVERIDLSSNEWPELPGAEIVNAAIAAARGRVNDYPDRLAAQVRAELARRHRVEPQQVVVGNGAAELLQAAALALLSPGDELVTAWPSYPLYPLMASRAGARPVPVPLAGGRADVDALLDAVGGRTRVVVLCNPNDPTGTYLTAEEVDRLAAGLPEDAHLLVDEAFVQFQDAEPQDAVLRLVDRHPRLVVFRTFSKIHGLAGLRAGYAVGSSESGRLLDSIAPALGVSALAQAAMSQALRTGDAEVDRRRRLVLEQRARLFDALHDMPVDAPPSQASFAWLRTPGLGGAELAARLERAGVTVAPGGPLGDEDHVRASIRGAAATDRLLEALAAVTGGRT
ncbi:MAG: aminotransferase class I/II-fold pyridoxal phosphate-dependent enzyme [Thermoleophilaceae bacterium]|nr:aminotransferase class I/II-fold pyridoxal phosphate-dependent enzyme [Thermoleophilaceae bacterium]